MFKIRGADGREYGPVTTDQLHQWVREGRAGAQTQVQPGGTTTWSPLGALPEFAAQFAAPPPLSPGRDGFMPPVVRTIAYALFCVATINTFWMLSSILSIWRYMHSSSSVHLGFTFYLGWVVGVLAIPVHFICGMGLLRGREWTRVLAVIFAIILAADGVWGISQTVDMILKNPASLPSLVLGSPAFLLSQVWGLALLAFNIATAVLLSRRAVRAAFSRKTPPAA